MAQTNLCRLCVKVCTNYTSLYNEIGQRNKICEIALKYFHPMFLTLDQALDFAVLCSDCCHQISDFYDFQLEVFKEQRQLLEGEGEAEIEFELKTKMCEEVIADDITNSHVGGKQYDCTSLPDLESMEELAIAHNLKKKDNQATPKNANEPPIQCENPKENNSDTEQSEDHASNTSKSMQDNNSDCNQLNPSTKRKRKQRSSRKDLDAVIAQWKPSLECVVCKKSVPNFTSLRQHFLDEHPKERCHVKCCHRKFYLRWKVEDHARLHLYPYTFKCEMCDSWHASKSALYLHLRTVHSLKQKEDVSPHDSAETQSHNKKKVTGKRKSKKIDYTADPSKSSVECVHCSVTYPNFTALKQHFQHDHPTEWCYAVCCQQKFYRRNTFEHHVQLHLDQNVAKCEHPAAPKTLI